MTFDLKATLPLAGLVTAFTDRFEYTRPRLKGLALAGALSFPAFHLVWTVVFPQPYENLPLRLGGFLLCALLFAAECRPGLLGRHHRAWVYATLILCLPFFFTFMALANGLTPVGLGSAVAAVLVLALLHDPLNLAVSVAAGTALAVAAHLAVTGGAMPEGCWAALPVLGLALAGGLGLNLSADLAALGRRLGVARALGGIIAHEMRTPLAAITLDAETLQIDAIELRALLAAADTAGPAGCPALARTAAGRADDLAETADNLHGLATQANTTVDLLLTNIGGGRFNPTPLARFSMAAAVDRALADYPFPAGTRRLVEWHRDADFVVAGSDILMRHVLFNLLRNALRAVAAARRRPGGTLLIRLEPGCDRNRLVVRDTGTGVKPEHLPHLFEDFWSARPDGTSAGLGLSFARRTIEGLGGTIACRSEYGHYTEFTISLPPAKD